MVGVYKNERYMINKEYLTVNDVSKYYKTTTRNVRRIISVIKDEANINMLMKNNDNTWLIHHLLLPKFRPQRKRESKYYALTIRPSSDYSKKVLDEMMMFIFSQFADSELEINYTIECSEKNSFYNHIHCYVKTKGKRDLIRQFRELFYKLDYKQSSIYDLENWKKYITKEGSPIIQLKK
jgi:hypothetical protein